jgi:hypothetical protein
MITRNHQPTQRMKTLSARANEAYDQGYSENFKILDKKLTTSDGEFNYETTDVTIDNTYRFDNYADSQDTSILYLIQTRSGKRGTLIDTYGIYADGVVSGFVREVTDIKSINRVG